MRNRPFVVRGVALSLVAVAWLAMAFACDETRRNYWDDDDDDGGTGGGSTTSVTPDGGDACLSTCTSLYICSQQPTLCPGLLDTGLADWLYGAGDNGCMATCSASPALSALVDPNDCEGTITTISAVDSTFDAACHGSDDPCLTACTELYGCAQQVCPSPVAADLNEWLNGAAGDGCLGSCEQNPVLVSLVDPTDCESTVATIASLDPTFNELCYAAP